MFSPHAKLIFAALALLAWPWLIPGSQAEAAFRAELRASSVPPLGPVLVASGDLHGDAALEMATPSPDNTGGAGPPIQSPDKRPDDQIPIHAQWFSLATTANNGASAPGTIPLGGGAGLPFILPAVPRVPDLALAGLQRQRSERVRASLFSSGVFRPPR